jgi:hypothetical protein
MTQPISLRLPGTPAIPRSLQLNLSAGFLYAQAFTAPSDAHPICALFYATDRLEACQLDHGCRDIYTLWLGRAAADVTAAEAEQIHAAFAAAGLRSVWPHVPNAVTEPQS